MCMDPNLVIDCINNCKRTVTGKESTFLAHLETLEKALDGIVIGEIDRDALCHSFL